jgi:hypothetical protein
MQKAPLGQQKVRSGQVNRCVPAGQDEVVGAAADEGTLAAVNAARASTMRASFLRMD